MTALVAWLRPRWDAAAVTVATAAGTLLRLVGRGLPGTLGPALVAVGLWTAWRPLGWIFAGLVLWALDRRV